MIDQGKIRDSHTIVAVTLAMRYLNKKCPDDINISNYVKSGSR
jgi:hypothetical protein